MPTYSYICNNRHVFTKELKMSEVTDVLPCPICGATALRDYRHQRVYTPDMPTGGGRNQHRNRARPQE